MRFFIFLTVTLAVLNSALAAEQQQQQQRILRRVIKSTPTATSLGRIRAVTISSPQQQESGAVTEISSKEAAKFGDRSANETANLNSAASPAQAPTAQPLVASAGTKTRQITSSSSSSATTSTQATISTTTSTTTPSPAPITTSTSTTSKPKASDRQQQASSQGTNEVELLSSAPSSWQMMTAVEAPAAMLIATGTRSVQTSLSNDLASSSSSTSYSSEESANSQTGDFLRSSSSATKGGHGVSGETFSRLRQQHAASKQQNYQQQQQQQQQNFFYPQQAQARVASKINTQPLKTPWYQTTTAAPRPAPIVQQEQYEQQNEQYVEQQQQQQQIEYGAAPLGQAEPFAFDFKTEDNSGNGQYRKEESDKNGVVRGSYGYTDANGIYRHVEYVADQNGFRANIKSNEPGLIGETQPASIQLAGGAAPATGNSPRTSNQPLRNPNENGDWVASSSSSNNNNQAASADLALAPPDFESSHKSQDRARLPRHFRN